MDFYARQAAARGQSRWLVLGFALSLLAIALALDLVLFTFLSSREPGMPAAAPLEFAARNPGAALTSTLIVMGVLGLASLYKSMELRGGGGVVARSLGGVLVARDASDLKRKRLLNIVEEMAIASGVPMPEVYILEQETGINAFAAGHTPANAAITVTQGALDQLNRDQLQGVIGHEFSHILNGDMRLNVQLMGWVFGLFVVALIGRMIVNFSPRNRRSSGGIIGLGFAVMVLGYVGLLAGRILQAAVSRQRERLADASGVQFTRNPQGLRDALVKIAATEDGSLITESHAEEAAHMFFAPAFSRVFATHPPLMERIKQLDPHFNPRELPEIAAQLEEQAAREEQVEAAGAGARAPGAGGPGAALRTAALFGASPAPAGSSAGAAGVAGIVGGSIAASAAPGLAISVVNQVGRPGTAHIQQAQAINLALPDSLRDFAESPGRAQAFVLALLLSPEQAVRARQLDLLGQRLGVTNFAALQQIAPIANALPPMLRLPALQQLFPALRRAPPAQRKALAQLADVLIQADSRIDVFEFCLAKLLESLLNDELQARVPHGTLSLEDEQDEIALLFATLAYVGGEDERNARMAFEAGMSTVLPMRRPAYAQPQDWARQLGDALPRLDRLHPFAKKVVIEGLVKTISNDGMINEAESELLRTVCSLLHCPLPAGFAQTTVGQASS
ncbi:MAG TPA: M48 family metallopeptidase [Steroidobacteraceae bacterium]|nr:M48 family metallopeptidase [Steroidobacteraceae bacterium]